MRPLIFICLLLVATCVSSQADVIYVDVDAVGENDGSSWTNAFNDLQDALAAVAPEDSIWIAEGVYMPSTTGDRFAFFEIPSGVDLFGGFTGVETALDQRSGDRTLTELSGRLDPDEPFNAGANSLRILVIRDSAEEVVIDGMTVLGAWGWAPQPDDRTATAVVVERSPIVMRNVTVADSGYWNGENNSGGIEFVDCEQALLQDVDFSGCWGAKGGSIYCENTDLVLEHAYLTQFTQGFPSLGTPVDDREPWPSFRNWGGVAGDEESLLTIRDSEFDDCFGVTYGALSGVVDLRDVIIRNCYADEGRGAGGFVGRGTLVNVQFIGNTGDTSAGAMLGSGLLRNVVFRGNQSINTGSFAGALQSDGPTRLQNCSFVGNHLDGPLGLESVGGAAHFVGPGPFDVDNTLVWGNRTRLRDGSVIWQPSSFTSDGAEVQIAHSLVEGSGGSGEAWDSTLGIDLGGNLDVDPLLVDLEGGDLRLSPGSPAINRGNSALLSSENVVDLDGNPRVVGGSVDIGAYEYQGPDCETFEVVFGASWDPEPSLQDILDAEYGVDVIDAATDYEGYACGDAIVPYWLDDAVDGWIIREVGGYERRNTLGWYAENFEVPVIDGVDDGVIFEGGDGEGDVAFVGLTGPTRFGLYLNPNGTEDAINAPEPELFFTNRRYNDVGPDGSGAVHAPDGGDPQALIYDVSALHDGNPTYVIAWEDVDSGAEITAGYTPVSTDNDYNDLVVEIRASSPVSLDDELEPNTPTLVSDARLSVAPNPFNPTTSVIFAVPFAQRARVVVYDVRGREVEVLFDGRSSGAERAVTWTPSESASGVYFIRLESSQRVLTEKVTLIK